MSPPLDQNFLTCPYAFLFAGCTKETPYNVRTGLEVIVIGVFIDEDKESRELCRWEGGPAI